MNQQIQNLSKKAWLLAHEANDQAEEDEGEELTETEFNNVFQQKFAELIVEECANIVADAVNHREPASTYVDKIKQHFGVEE